MTHVGHVTYGCCHVTCWVTDVEGCHVTCSCSHVTHCVTGMRRSRDPLRRSRDQACCGNGRCDGVESGFTCPEVCRAVLPVGVYALGQLYQYACMSCAS